MIIASLAILNVRYALYCYETEQQTVSPVLMAIIVCASDFVPPVCLIGIIHLEGSGCWDCLLVNYLKAPQPEDRSTECGSQILRGLKNEVAYEILFEKDFPSTHRPSVDSQWFMAEFDQVVEADPLSWHSEKRRLSRSVDDSGQGYLSCGDLLQETSVSTKE